MPSQPLPRACKLCRSPWVGLLATLGPGREAQVQAHADSARCHCPLSGLRSCCHPAHSSHRPHLCLPGTAAQIFWDQSGHLSRRDRTLPRPGGVSVRVTAEIPEPLSPVWGQRSSLHPLSPLLCLASACGQPVPDSPFLFHPLLSTSVTSGVFLSLFSPLYCWFVWVFFCCLPTALLATSSALTSLSPVPYGPPRSRTVLSRGERGIQPSAPCLVTEPHGAGGASSTCARTAAGRACSQPLLQAARGDAGSAQQGPVFPQCLCPHALLRWPQGSLASPLCFPASPNTSCFCLAKTHQRPTAAGLFRDCASYQ